MIDFLSAVSDTNNLPAFVHCRRGADRTGMMCATYRVAVCGWTRQEAVPEMKNGGPDFSTAWNNLVEFVEKTGVRDVQRRAGFP